MVMPFDQNESTLVQKFRNRVSDVVSAENLRDDHFLIRWIRARDMDLDKAEVMLRKAMDWFYRNEMDIILDWQPRKNYYRFAMAGHDAEGCPVFIFPVGFWNLYEAPEMCDAVPALRFALRILAQAEQEVKLSCQRLQDPVTQFVVIVDFQQFAYFRNLNDRNVVQAGIQLARIFESNFPERLKSCTVVNASRLFPLILAIGKPFFSGRTLNKLEVYGSHRRKWIAALEKKVPMEIIPPYYGGTRPGNDEYCSNSSMWNDGQPLPAHYYGINTCSSLTSCTTDLDTEEHCYNGGVTWKRQDIKAGSKIDLEFRISPDLCKSHLKILSWKIKSEGFDIGMKVVFKAEGQYGNQDVVEYRRIDCHLTPTTGSLVCENPGVYTLILDNSYSKRRNKTVSYIVNLYENECGPDSSLQLSKKSNY